MPFVVLFHLGHCFPVRKKCGMSLRPEKNLLTFGKFSTFLLYILFLCIKKDKSFCVWFGGLALAGFRSFLGN